MNLAGDQILADAAFPGDEHFRVTSGHARREREDFAHLRAGVHHRAGFVEADSVASAIGIASLLTWASETASRDSRRGKPARLRSVSFVAVSP